MARTAENTKWGFEAGEGVLVDALEDTPEAAAFAKLAHFDDPDDVAAEVVAAWPATLLEITSGAADNVIDHVAEHVHENFGEYAGEHFDGIKPEEVNELQHKIATVFKHWMRKHKRRPPCWHLGESRYYEIVKRDADGFPSELKEVDMRTYRSLVGLSELPATKH